MALSIIRKWYQTYRKFMNFLTMEYYFLRCKFFRAEEWKDPDKKKFDEIESNLRQIGIPLYDIFFNKHDFERFRINFDFGANFYGGPDNKRVYSEKIFEHFIANEMVIKKIHASKDIYIDVAAGGSPWVKMLRDNGYLAYAIDLSPSKFQNLEYYRIMDATDTTFTTGSVSAVSLQCAFEMFNYDDDIRFIRELGRILAIGGRAVIVPFYMNTRYSGYCSPEYWNRPNSRPQDLKIYVNYHAENIPFSRKYDAETFLYRIARKIRENNMEYRLYVVRNGDEIDPTIYCHFVLEIFKPYVVS